MTARRRAARRAASYLPRPVQVVTGADARPTEVDGRLVEALQEEWLIEDRWWTPQPLRRHYYEVVLENGSNTVIFRDGHKRSWYVQRG